jgi:hypothetical protein
MRRNGLGGTGSETPAVRNCSDQMYVSGTWSGDSQALLGKLDAQIAASTADLRTRMAQLRSNTAAPATQNRAF